MRWFLLLALAAVAHADGKFVSTQVPKVEIPDQQAILVWKDGRERLVIDTAFAGEGDLAWIVPLPAPPKIEPVSPAVFRTLEVVTMPALEDEPSRLWRMGLYLLVAIALIGVIPARRILVRTVAMFVLFLGFALFFFSLLAKTSSVVHGVTVLERGRAGSYETATIQSVDAGALLSWLKDNGFQVAPEAREAIEEYVRDGWVFATARLMSRGSGGRPHPLSFEFDAREPVYPMRLTATQDRGVSLRLFVLSDRRARCDALTTESCYETGTSDDALSYGRDEDEVRLIGQPELLRIADGATVLTTLQGDLGPDRTRKDLTFGFEKYVPLVPVLYSEDAARSGAASTAVWVALALLLPCYLILRTRAGRRGRIVAWCVAIDLGLLAGVADYVTTDTVETRGKGDSPFGLLDSHWRARQLVAGEPTHDIEKARVVAATFWRGQTNVYDGLEVREEASPGNYGLEMRDGRVAYIRYDSRGGLAER